MEGLFLSAKGRGQDRNKNLVLSTVQSRVVSGLCQFQKQPANDQRGGFILWKTHTASHVHTKSDPGTLTAVMLELNPQRPG